jgi:ornithine cyclodeaminase/alanine dehydrogenase-like protein (mu-crystallin family)
VLILRPEETRGLITMAEAVEVTEIAFRDWGRIHGLNAPRRRVHAPSGVRVSVHQGAAPTLGMTGLFTHCELVHPMAQEQVYDAIADPAYVLFDASTGALACLIVGELTPQEMPDTLVMTGLRTATTSAVGTKVLAREDAHTVGLFGAGSQARYHLLALAAIRPITLVKVYRRTAEERRRFAAEMSEVMGIEVQPVDTPQEVIHDVDIVLAATNASVPVFDGYWLEPGQHVTSIVGSNVGLVEGGFTPRKRREIDDTTLTRSDIIMAASREQVLQDKQGDLYDPIQQDLISLEQVHELGDALVGQAPVRTSTQQITLFKNNAGQGIADVAIAARVYQRARERGLGQELPFDAWSVQGRVRGRV